MDAIDVEAVYGEKGEAPSECVPITAEEAKQILDEISGEKPEV